MKTKLILYSIGLIIILVGLFGNLIGTNPDSGVIELSEKSLRVLICSFGALFIFAGFKYEDRKI